MSWGLPQEVVCAHLEAITWGRLRQLGLRNRALANVPPGSMKSLLVSVFWAAWEWGPCGLHSNKFVQTSYGPAPVDRDNLKFQTLITSDWFQSKWPMRFLRNATDEMVNQFQGSRMSAPFGSLTSLRGDRFVLDDPHSTETAESDNDREKTTRRFREGALNRLNDQEESAIVVIMQRLHQNDISGVILRDLKGYVHINLPMEFEKDRACYTPLPVEGQQPLDMVYDADKQSWYLPTAIPPHRVKEMDGIAPVKVYKHDPRTREGQLLDPVRFPKEAVELIKVEMGSYAYAGQYQERPSPREGNLFKRAWFADKVIRVAPAGTRWVRAWDLGGTEETRGDPTAGVKMGKTPDGRFIVADCKHFRAEGDEVRQVIKSVAQTDGKAIMISLPQDPGQAGKTQAKDYVVMLAGWLVRARPETGDKLVRAEPFSVQCEAGNVYFLEGEYLEPYIDELCEFPSGRHDDRVDASSTAFARLLESNAGVVAAPIVVTQAYSPMGDHPGIG